MKNKWNILCLLTVLYYSLNMRVCFVSCGWVWSAPCFCRDKALCSTWLHTQLLNQLSLQSVQSYYRLLTHLWPQPLSIQIKFWLAFNICPSTDNEVNCYTMFSHYLGTYCMHVFEVLKDASGHSSIMEEHLWNSNWF